MAETVKSRILWVIIGSFITFMLGLNAYYQKSTTDATKENNKEMQEINQNLTEFKSDQNGKNEFIFFRFTQHEDKIKEICEHVDNNSERISIVENKVKYITQ